MLDAKELAKRLRAAMDNHTPRILSVDLAAKCGVTPQAVNGWRTTGRIAKRHLFTICQETGLPIEFFLEDRRGETQTTKKAWQRVAASLAILSMLTSALPGAVRNVDAAVYFVKSLPWRFFAYFRTSRIARA